jgi:hypothetical protein
LRIILEKSAFPPEKMLDEIVASDTITASLEFFSRFVGAGIVHVLVQASLTAGRKRPGGSGGVRQLGEARALARSGLLSACSFLAIAG